MSQLPQQKSNSNINSHSTEYRKTVSIFGCTGSIGKNVYQLVKENINRFEVVVLVAKNNWQELLEQAKILKPKFIVIEDESNYQNLKNAVNISKINCQVLSGADAIVETAKIKVDLIFMAIVGAVAIMPTITAIKAGSNLAIANKESLVIAGNFITEMARLNNINLIPLDSEHNAILQIFENHNLENISNITLTASGGPFFNNKKPLDKITIAEAINHPKWQMGAKISVDSATMMNKGLELIEAYHLFAIDKSQIKVLIHPQSIVHGMVQYSDGSNLAMLSYPNMQTPISLALNFPKRTAVSKIKPLDLAEISRLDFFEVDYLYFPTLKLAIEALNSNDTAVVALNAANEIAVAAFLNNEISFDKISNIIAKTLETIAHHKINSIEEVLFFDQQFRNLTKSLCH